MLGMFLLATLAACGLLPDEPQPPGCAERKAFYPDEDGDGVGDGSDVYVGCEAPRGWVAVPPPADTAVPTDSAGSDEGSAPE